MMTTTLATYLCLSASARCTSRQVLRMKSGLSDLSMVAAVAPLLGVFATCFGIVNSFIPSATDRLTLFAAIVRRLAESLWPAALGILIGLLALWIRRWLLNRVNGSAARLGAATVELAQFLANAEVTQWNFAPPYVEPAVLAPKPAESNARFRKAVGAVVTLAALGGAWALQPSHLWFVIYAFLLSLFPAQVLARRIFDHRGGVFPIAALMSCFWCAVAG